jgi:hypothetical protein
MYRLFQVLKIGINLIPILSCRWDETGLHSEWKESSNLSFRTISTKYRIRASCVSVVYSKVEANIFALKLRETH